MPKVKESSFNLHPRNCPLCGESRLRTIWDYRHVERTRHYNFVWSVRNVVCERCGFGFVSPSPPEDELARYYGDSFPLSGEGYFSVDARMAVLRRCANLSGAGCIVEIGSNAAGEFLSRLNASFKDVVSVELNSSCDANVRRTRDLPSGMADVVAAYFVLEHVPDVVSFLFECRRIARENGLVIIEVPNLHLYPTTVAALDFHEHVNHFSPLTLEWLAARCGLQIVEISHHECSRPFGFVSVFRPAEVRSYDEGWNERANSLACFAAGLELVRTKRRGFEEHRAYLRAAVASGQRVVIWAANATCGKLLDGFASAGLTVVDNDHMKSNFLDNMPVHHPDDVRKEIREADVILICTAVHARKICDYIAEQLCTDVKAKNVRLIDL